MDNGKPREGQLCRLVIDGYASDGAGVARLDGMVVFVQGGIRGEACDVRLTHVGRSALWGRVEAVSYTHLDVYKRQHPDPRHRARNRGYRAKSPAFSPARRLVSRGRKRRWRFR